MNNDLTEIDREEALLINGGSIEGFLRKTWWGALIYYGIDNWDDLKGGASSAYNDYYNKN